MRPIKYGQIKRISMVMTYIILNRAAKYPQQQAIALHPNP